jgi:hypothetical protein
MSFSPRRVRNSPTVALYECRLLNCTVRTASLLRYVEGRLKKWRGVQRWCAQCYCSARGEVVVQAVVERTAVASRVDNLLQAWRKLVVKMLPAPVQAKQMKRGVWCNEVLVDVRFMAEPWDTACAKLGAEATASDSSAVKCSYLEPALPSSAQSNAVTSVSKAAEPPKSASLGILNNAPESKRSQQDGHPPVLHGHAVSASSTEAPASAVPTKREALSLPHALPPLSIAVSSSLGRR